MSWHPRLRLLLQGNLSNPTPPYASANYSALAFPAPVAYPFFSASNDGICNTYLPNDSTLNRRAVPQTHTALARQCALRTRCFSGPVQNLQLCRGVMLLISLKQIWKEGGSCMVLGVGSESQA